METTRTGRILVYIPLLITIVGAATAAITIFLLYGVHVGEQKTRLQQIVQTQARLIESVAEFDVQHSTEDNAGDSFDVTLNQVIKAHQSLGIFGKSGEFVVGRKLDDDIGLLFFDPDTKQASFQKPSYPALPMTEALSGNSGVSFSTDYRGVEVLAAYEPVAILEIGLVAKIDKAEVIEPFKWAAGIAGTISLAMLFVSLLAARQLVGPVLAQQRTLADLAQSQRDLAKAQAIAKLGSWRRNLADNTEVWSDEHVRIFGYEPGTIEPTSDLVWDGIHPHDRDAFMKAEEAAIRGEEPFDMELRIVQPGGEVRTITTQAEVEYGPDGSPQFVIGTILDITDRIELKATLVQTAKMATLGEMATGMAHEINQPLNVITMAASNILRKIKKEDVPLPYLQEKLNKITEQTRRAANIIDHMRVFGRKDGGAPERVSIESCIGDSLDLIGEQLKLSSISLDVSTPPTPTFVIGRKIQFEQVFLNLLTNAKQAMEEHTSPDQRFLRIVVEDNTTNGQVHIDVCDTGGGIPGHTLDRIFEPFFTTKKVGVGTGLGLSILYGIITEANGTIQARNVDKGTCFTITLPRAESAANKSETQEKHTQTTNK